MGRMAGGGDAWGVQKEPRVEHWETGPGLQLLPGRVLCSVRQLSGICCPLPDSLQPPLPFFCWLPPCICTGLWQLHPPLEPGMMSLPPSPAASTAH